MASTSPPTSSLYTPIKLGSSLLRHRVVLAPLTRQRANKQHVHGPLALEYYAQRAAVPGTLLITEATFIAAQAGGFNNVPGIWDEQQIRAWKKVSMDAPITKLDLVLGFFIILSNLFIHVL